MNTDDHSLTLSRCLRQIEEKLGWGASDNWSSQDFERLSELIADETNVSLSPTTLKRVWGRIKYESAPTTNTLNTLAQYIGFADWRTFRQSGVREIHGETVSNPVTTQTTARPKYKLVWMLLLIAVPLFGYFIVQANRNINPEKLNTSLFSFSANKVVSEGVPNSVVFRYDAKAAKTDSVFIVQTWDISRKKRVSKNEGSHSAIYYYPGYFRAKLLADQQIVKEHDLWITSGGWLCLAEGEPVPVYFKKEECLRNGTVMVDESVLKKYNLALHPVAPRIRLFNQGDLGNIKTDNFTFETVVKNDFSQGANACQPVQVLIQCKGDVMIIPLAAKTCVGDLALTFCGEFITSQDGDLSGFGADLAQWTTVRVEVVDKKATLFVNGRKAYTTRFSHEPSDIVGVQYRLNGTGAVKDTWFEANGKKIRL